MDKKKCTHDCEHGADGAPADGCSCCFYCDGCNGYVAFGWFCLHGVGSDHMELAGRGSVRIPDEVPEIVSVSV